jgi:hypothetical protein
MDLQRKLSTPSESVRLRENSHFAMKPSRELRSDASRVPFPRSSYIC